MKSSVYAGSPLKIPNEFQDNLPKVAPSKLIEGIKKQVDLMNKDNNRFKNMVENNDGKFNQKTKDIAEIKKKSK
jgi:hypothetical protein